MSAGSDGLMPICSNRDKTKSSIGLRIPRAVLGWGGVGCLTGCKAQCSVWARVKRIGTGSPKPPEGASKPLPPKKIVTASSLLPFIANFEIARVRDISVCVNPFIVAHSEGAVNSFFVAS